MSGFKKVAMFQRPQHEANVAERAADTARHTATLEAAVAKRIAEIKELDEYRLKMESEMFAIKLQEEEDDDFEKIMMRLKKIAKDFKVCCHILSLHPRLAANLNFASLIRWSYRYPLYLSTAGVYIHGRAAFGRARGGRGASREGRRGRARRLCRRAGVAPPGRVVPPDARHVRGRGRECRSPVCVRRDAVVVLLPRERVRRARLPSHRRARAGIAAHARQVVESCLYVS